MNLTPHRKDQMMLKKVPFSDDIDEDLETSDNVEQHPTVEA